jgi:hypothetical protein
MAGPRPGGAWSSSAVILLVIAAVMCDAFNHPAHARTSRAGIDGQILSSLRTCRRLHPHTFSWTWRSPKPRVWMMGIGGVDRGDFRGDYGKDEVGNLELRDCLVTFTYDASKSRVWRCPRLLSAKNELKGSNEGWHRAASSSPYICAKWYLDSAPLRVRHCKGAADVNAVHAPRHSHSPHRKDLACLESPSHRQSSSRSNSKAEMLKR